jgi:hypothetical protein
MTASDLLVFIRSLGIELQVDGDKLHYHAPRGTMTPELRATIVEHKAALIEMLRSRPRRVWIHLWNSRLEDLAGRRDELREVLDSGRSKLGEWATRYGPESEKYQRGARKFEILAAHIERAEKVLEIRRIAEAAGAKELRPSAVPCWVCGSTGFWIQPACGEWRCAICSPPLPGVRLIRFESLVKPIRRV